MRRENDWSFVVAFVVACVKADEDELGFSGFCQVGVVMACLV